MEDNDNLDLPQRVTAKQRVLQARGQEVPLDYFLYSCLERERLELAKKEVGQVTIIWPLLRPDAQVGAPADLTATSLHELIGSLVAWYADAFPELAESQVLDHEQLVKVVPPFVALCRDFNRLHREKTGDSLPAVDRSATQDAVWQAIDQALIAHFPTYQHLFSRYLQWTHASVPKEEFEPGSRPPVGRYAPPPPPRSSSRDGRSGRPDRGPPRSASDRGPSRSNFDRAAHPPERERGPRTERGPRPERPTEARPGRGPQPERGRRPRGDEPRRSRGEDDEQTARLRAAALADVDQAIATLKTDGSLNEIVLKPTNSFYRRIQHQQIVDAGFHSNSVGEGPDRAVKISKTENS